MMINTIDGLTISKIKNKERFSEFFGYIDKSKKTYIGVSGGPDSMFVVSIISLLCEDITLLYFDHGIRKETSEDIAIIKTFFPKIKLIIGKSKKPGKNETEFRNQRYRFFDNQIEDDAILYLGHNLTDRVETSIINSIRGCGIVGLYSIKGYTKRRNYSIIRPAIFLGKQTIFGINQELGIPYIVDETNTDSGFTIRNKIRNNTIPDYIKLNNLTIEQFYDKRKMLYNNLTKIINKSKKLITLSSYRSPDQRKTNNYYGFFIKTELDTRILLSQLGISGVSVYEVKKLYNLFTGKRNGVMYTSGRNFIHSFGKNYCIEGKNKFWKEEPYDINKLVIFFNLNINKKYTLFSPGDRIGSKKIKKIFNEHKIPIFRRNFLPLELNNPTNAINIKILENSNSFW